MREDTARESAQVESRAARNVNHDRGSTRRNACKLNVNRAIDSQGQRNAFCVINCERDVVGLHLITSLGKIYHDRLEAENKEICVWHPRER